MFNMLDQNRNKEYFFRRVAQVIVSIEDRREDELHWVERDDEVTDGIKLGGETRKRKQSSKK